MRKVSEERDIMGWFADEEDIDILGRGGRVAWEDRRLMVP